MSHPPPSSLILSFGRLRRPDAIRDAVLPIYRLKSQRQHELISGNSSFEGPVLRTRTHNNFSAGAPSSSSREGSAPAPLGARTLPTSPLADARDRAAFTQHSLNALYGLAMMGSTDQLSALLTQFLAVYTWIDRDLPVHHYQLYHAYLAWAVEHTAQKNSSAAASASGRGPGAEKATAPRPSPGEPGLQALLQPDWVQWLSASVHRIQQKENLQMHSGHFHTAVLKVCRRLRLPFEAEWVEPASKFIVDIWLPERNLIVEVDGALHFLRSSSEQGAAPVLNGSTVFKHRVLRGLGYKVLSIGFFDWDALPENERGKFLLRSIEEVSS